MSWKIADIGSGDVTILTNHGDGSFSVAQVIELPGSTPYSIVAGNFGDGEVDLAVANATGVYANTVDLLKGNGDGTFQPTPVAALPVGATPFSIVAGDFGNGNLDLAVADYGDEDVSVLMNNGDATFKPAIHSATTGSGLLACKWRASRDRAGRYRGGRLHRQRPPRPRHRELRLFDISVLLAQGDGSFEEPPSSPVGDDPVSDRDR